MIGTKKLNSSGSGLLLVIEAIATVGNHMHTDVEIIGVAATQ